jgi:hypothetical protein
MAGWFTITDPRRSAEILQHTCCRGFVDQRKVQHVAITRDAATRTVSSYLEENW